MAQYYKLVACYKNKYSFINEQELEVIKDKNTSIMDIDYITCHYPNEKFLIELLDRDGIISGKNHLSIKYNRKGQYHYLSPLFNHIEMLDIIENLCQRTIYQNGHPETHKVVPISNPFFQEKKREFYNYIKENPEYFFSEVYKDKPPRELERLVYNYHEARRTEPTTLEDVYLFDDLARQIQQEFSKYSVFRDYLIKTDKYFGKDNSIESNEISSNSTSDDFNSEVDDEHEEFLTAKEMKLALNDELSTWKYGPKPRG